VELHHEISGEGSPVLLAHGFSANLDSWAFQRAPLAAKHRLVLCDLPGHGRSPCLERPSLDGFADAMCRLLDHLQIDRAHVGGISMGGMIALAFAIRHADRLRSLVVADTAAIRLPWALRVVFSLFGWLGGLGLRLPQKNLAFPGLGRPIEGDDGAHLTSPELALVERGVSRHQFPSQMLWTAGAVARHGDQSRRLAGIRVPTLVIVGEKDPVRVHTEAMQRAIANSELVVVPGSVHGTAVNRPAFFNAALLAFLERADASFTLTDGAAG
jgi:pimeloyl-ACP methyl ester carboxylesterase